MRLRQKLEDFKVEEANRFDILKRGKYKLFLLEKQGLETFSLINYLSKKNKIPANAFGIAGLKDRYAITKQYFTIPAKFDIRTLEEKNFRIKFLGFLDKEIKLGNLEQNNFEICVRSVGKGELNGIEQKAVNLRETGVPNYFDSQRFGSVIAGKFIGKFVIKKNYEEAVKVFVTHYTKSEKKNVKDEKRKMFENWKNISKMDIKNRALKEIIDEYKKTKSWLEAYKKIPLHLRKMFILAYQSYLWNECVKEILQEKIDKKHLFSVEYNAGELLFYKNTGEDELKSIPKTLDSITPNTKPNDIFEKILKKEGLSVKEFDIKESGNFFHEFKREVIVKPINLKVSDGIPDELNQTRYKILLKFGLHKGSYATMITKRIFGH